MKTCHKRRPGTAPGDRHLVDPVWIAVYSNCYLKMRVPRFCPTIHAKNYPDSESKYLAPKCLEVVTDFLRGMVEFRVNDNQSFAFLGMRYCRDGAPHAQLSIENKAIPSDLAAAINFLS